MHVRRGAVFLSVFFMIAMCGLFVYSGFAITPDTQSTSQTYIDNASTASTLDTTYLITFNTTTTDQSLEQLKGAAAQSQQPFIEHAATDPNIDVHNTFWLKSSALVSVNSTAINQSQLAAIDGVDTIYNNDNLTVSADNDHEQNTSSVANSQPEETTYGLEMIKATETQEAFETTGSGVDVAVLDTGLDPDHDAIDVGEWAAFDDSGELTSSDPDDAHDPEGHGTHVGGTIAGDPVSDTQIGVAPDATLHGVQVLDDDLSGSFAQVVAGMEWVVETHQEDNGIDFDIMQMSLGSDDTTAEVFVEPVQNAIANDIIVSVSVGNDGVNDSSSPGNVYGSLAAGAVDDSRDVPSFSGGEWINSTTQWDKSAEEWPETDPDWPDEYLVPDVVAPGVAVLSAETGTTTGTTPKSGTSMASPHVAGTAALLLAEGVDPSTAESAIVNSAVHPDGPTAYDNRYGYGVIDSFGAMTYARSDVTLEGSATLIDADGNHVPADHVTIQTDFGNVSTVTDDSGEYRLPLTSEGGKQTITANRIGWEPDVKTIDPVEEDGTVELDFSLDNQTLDADLQSPLPNRVSPGDSYSLTYDTLQTHAYTPYIEATTIDGDTTSVENFTLTVNGEPLASGEQHELSNAIQESVSVSIDTPDDFIGTVNVTHEFEGLDERTINRTTTDATVHPDPFALPDDHEPDQLQRVSTFVTEGTTIALDPDYEFSTTLDDDSPVGIAADQNVTLRGDGDMATIALTDTSTTEQTVGAGVSSNSTVENIALSGAADVGIMLADGTVSNVTVSGTTVGAEVTDGDIDDPQVGPNRLTAESKLLNLTIDNVDTGLQIADDIAMLQQLSVDATNTGILIDGGSVKHATNLSITGSETGVSVADTSQMMLDGGTVIDTETALTFGADATNVTVTNITIDDTTVAFNGPKTATDVSVQHAGVTTSLNGTDTHVAFNESPPIAHEGHGIVGGTLAVRPQSDDGTLSVQTTYDDHATRSAVTDTLSYYTLEDESWTVADSTGHSINQSHICGTFDTDTTAAIYGEGTPYINITAVTVPDTIAPDDRLDALVTIENTGAAPVTDTIIYSVNDSTVATDEQLLDPGESTETALLHAPVNHSSGEFSYQVSSLNTTYAGTYTVNPEATGADIEVTDVTIESATISPDQPLNLSIDLENSGDLNGTHPISVAAGDSELETAAYVTTNDTVTTTLSTDSPHEGTYDITVNGQSAGTLTVASDESLLDEYPELLILVIGTLLFILGLALFEWRYTDPV